MQTNYIELAKKCAIEGGYDEDALVYNDEYVFLDLLFWQSLGKSLGLDIDDGSNFGKMDWKDLWHSFINHLSKEKDPQDFFKSLLQVKE